MSNEPFEAGQSQAAAEGPAAKAERAGGGEATPVMAQYLEIKAANPDHLLWYRMGDFYELFFEDAVTAAEALGIVLTKRGKHLGQDIPMCGVPVHRADEYLQRLIKRGFRVAVCEQLEDPAEARKRGSKALVRRDVVRLVTPGTLTEEALLDAKARNYLTALLAVPAAGGQEAKRFALASLDISTGEFELSESGRADLGGELVRLSPSEVIASEPALTDIEIGRWLKAIGAALTPVAAATFDSLAGERALKARLGVTDLAAFGPFSRPELAAAAALLRYVELTQIGRQPMLRPPRRTGAAGVLLIDASSRASLELVRSTSGERQGSLLAAIDRTVTGAGARELAARLASPLAQVEPIIDRLDAVDYLLEREGLREKLRQTLRAAGDVARAVSRLALQRGSPRDLGAVRDGIAQGRACAALIEDAAAGVAPPRTLDLIVRRLQGVSTGLAEALTAALVEAPPPVKRDGGFVRTGYRAELDEARRLGEDSRRVMAALETKYAEATGIKSLKIRHNNILGYFIEVSAPAAKPLMSSPHRETFRHRQSMANAVRFTTAELTEMEGRIAAAAERALAIENEVFASLTAGIIGEQQALGALAGALAELDVHCALAELAASEGYVRPTVDGSTVFEVRGGRHPVVEQALKQAKSGPFIENDCLLVRANDRPAAFEEEAEGRIWLVTGPNMAGKSTFLRQNALITLMAQMGSFVPARAAHIGVADRLFSRVGASDDLARGRSTFMVEMVETAAILNQATERSLVVLDEIGRGTATFDGLSIAWATLEYLHDVSKARVLFATHYHELTQLAGRLEGVCPVTMDVREWRDDIVFMHKVKSGAADRSYGIQVAKLAGLPAPVVARAKEVLRRLERGDRRNGSRQAMLSDLPLFATAQAASEPVAASASPVEAALDAIDADGLSPRQALELIYRLKELRRTGKGATDQ
ncbi:MAG TPA: DNA mismatch repair protein MutS [Hyphomicrobiaceae bacterium]|nr:DNA mismatch repair protein MutS [Hyphomicrobiaceae bacterium]